MVILPPLPPWPVVLKFLQTAMTWITANKVQAAATLEAADKIRKRLQKTKPHSEPERVTLLEGVQVEHANLIANLAQQQKDLTAKLEEALLALQENLEPLGSKLEETAAAHLSLQSVQGEHANLIANLAQQQTELSQKLEKALATLQNGLDGLMTKADETASAHQAQFQSLSKQYKALRLAILALGVLALIALITSLLKV